MRINIYMIGSTNTRINIGINTSTKKIVTPNLAAQVPSHVLEVFTII